MPKFEFCIPTTGKVVPAGTERFHEIKYDGYRLRVERDGDRVRLITRGGYDEALPLDRCGRAEEPAQAIRYRWRGSCALP
jgi:ATP-dependent DNA ligase